MLGPDYRAGLLLASSVIAFAGAASAGETIAYRYDSLGRLVRVERTGINTNYAYDCADNRANMTAGQGVPPAPPPPPCPPPPPPPTRPAGGGPS